MTDDYPEDLSWELNDINRNEIVEVGGDYTDANVLIIEEMFLPTSSCYQFTINDSYGDGFYGYYKVSFENVIVMEGGVFGSSESSTLFGNGCPTQAEIEPAITPFPTQPNPPPPPPPRFFWGGGGRTSI